MLQNYQFFTKGVEIFKKRVANFSYPEWLASAKVEKITRNDKKVPLLLIYISGFYEKYSQELSNR